MSNPPAHLILTNGDIHTQNPRQPQAQAVAIHDNRILAVGDTRSIRKTAGRLTEVIDLAGRTVIPGMIDAHIHFYEWARKRRQLDLAEAASIQDLYERVAAFASSVPAGGWVIGYGWNEADWPERRMPGAAELDRAAPDHPVILWRCDFHLAVANTTALQIAGIGPHTPDPPEGMIERDARHAPTGVLRELAINLIREKIPTPSDGELLEALCDAIRHIHTLGVTGIHDVRLMNDAEGALAFKLWQRLNERHRLDLRCAVTIPGDQVEAAAALGLRTGMGDSRLRLGHLKFFADGGMGARTAWMLEPYLDAESGMPLTPPELLEQQVRMAESAGLAVMIHAVGDKANREVIRMFERIRADRPPAGGVAANPASECGAPGPSIPHRIEHVQMIHPDDIARLARSDLALCMTPENMILDINMVDASVGDRGRWAYAIRDLLETGRPLMFSSDCPVCPPSPLGGIHAAVTRRRRDGTPQEGWYPAGRVTLEEAIRAYTHAPAAANAQAHELGMIAPGMLADIAVFDRDLFAAEPMKLSEAKVDLTVFDGRVVHRRI